MKRKNDDIKIISYGLSSFGYDIRLSANSFYVYDEGYEEVDPKKFDSNMLVELPLESDESGLYFVMPPRTYGLGVSLERFDMPRNVSALCVGKSTYARCGIICNLTPIEAGWKGYLTLEIANSTDFFCRVYTNEGIAQVVFFEGESCAVSYSDRQGKYNEQTQQVVLPKV